MRKIIVAILSLASVGATHAQSKLYFNCKVFTNDDVLPMATYFVVENGMVVETGQQWDTLDMNRYSESEDMHGQVILPGIIDSHIHVIDGGLDLLQISFNGIETKKEFIEKIRLTKDSLLDDMYVGRALSDLALRDIGSPIALLDDLLADKPVIIFMKSGHAAIVNHAGLQKLGFRKNTKIEDGFIQKDSAGNFTGYLLEGAAMEANRIFSVHYSNETIQKAILAMQSLALSYGLTMVGDNTFNPYYYKVYQELQKQGRLKIRVRARSYGRISETEGLMKGVGRKHLGFIGGGVDPSRVRYHAMKFFEDQSLSPPAGDNGTLVPGGKVFLDVRDLNDVFQLHPGSTFAFHAQGKTGVQNIIDAVKANSRFTGHKRHIIDHAGYVSSQQVKEAFDLGLGITAIGGQLFDHKSLVNFYQHHSQATGTFVSDDLLDMRTKVTLAHAALTSDYPYGMDTAFAAFPQVDGLNPFPIIAVNATGLYPDGARITGVENKILTLNAALSAYTTHGAYVLNEDKTYGKIAPGYHADFIVMKDSLAMDDAFSWYNAHVDKTFIGGEKAFDAAVVPAPRATTYKKVRPSDYAISPVIGYDPTLGMILGAAYFRFPLTTPGQYFDVQFQTISGGKVNIQSTYTHFDIARNVDFGITASYSDYYQYYFGEGNTTRADSYAKLYANTWRAKPELSIKLRKNYRVNVFGDLRGRKETSATDKDGNDLGKTFFPNEHTLAVGLSLVQDTRDNGFSTKKGTLKQITIQHIPSAWNVSGLGSVTQVTAEIRHFLYVGNSNFVLASRLAAGFSNGSPSYLFRYSQGGPFALRGYYTNRFRGNKYYVGQLELRFPLYRLFSGAAFVDAGDIADTDFNQPKFTYGAGLRIALSHTIKLRLDYGVAKDQNGVFFTFSEAF